MADAAGDYRDSQKYAENQERERKAEHQKEHDRLIESDKVAHNGQGGRPTGLKTDFISYSINGLRSMILDSQPGKIAEAGSHWKNVHNILSGGDGDGKTGGVDQVSAKDSVAGMLQSAVDNVLQHWEGQAAEAFRKKAADIGVQLRNGAAHANFTAEQLFAVSKDLDASKAKMEDIKEPSLAERASDKLNDDGRDDSQMKKDLAAGVRADTVAKADEKNLSLQMERRLQAVAVMEDLAANYQVYTKNLNSAGAINHREGVNPPENNVTMPPPVTVPSGSAGGPSAGRAANKPWSAGSTSSIKPAPTVPRDPGITGGAQLPTASSQLPTAKTNVDSISPGLSGTGSGTGVGEAGVGGGGGLGIGGARGAGLGVPGGAAGLAEGSAGGLGALAGRGGLAGGAAAGRGAGGRAGMGGMGGGGLGAAGRGGASAGGRGALARARGGVVGAAKGVGKGAGGGAGLHGSRGGTQAGAAGAGGKDRRKKENSQGDRPDYLVEDEETWISEEDRNRNVPRTIE
ncbi:hypothetical protein ACIBW9_30225 [Streptomyces sp. NPDC049541]|uniref:hypothetical protein n=1 Tax=Streptomyces sp. NPDC049541 TaxID=3365594 RepID=UPI00379A71AE